MYWWWSSWSSCSWWLWSLIAGRACSGSHRRYNNLNHKSNGIRRNVQARALNNRSRNSRPTLTSGSQVSPAEATVPARNHPDTAEHLINRFVGGRIGFLFGTLQPCLPTLQHKWLEKKGNDPNDLQPFHPPTSFSTPVTSRPQDQRERSTLGIHTYKDEKPTDDGRQTERSRVVDDHTNDMEKQYRMTASFDDTSRRSCRKEEYTPKRRKDNLGTMKQFSLFFTLLCLIPSSALLSCVQPPPPVLLFLHPALVPQSVMSPQ